MLTISSSGTSNAGQKNINEDNFYMNGIFIAEGNARSGGLYSDSKRRNIQFYAVFDGIGEEVESAVNPNISFHEGQESSLTAASMMSKLQQFIIKSRKNGKPYNLNDAVYRYTQKTNQKLFTKMQKNNVRSGASFALLCIDGVKICAYNIGNCKIFILREGRLNLLTKNDTKVEELIYANQISQEIAKYTPENKVLTQYLGLYPEEKQTDLHINNKLTLRPGDKFLLCSDALCDVVSDARLLEIMQQDISEQETIRELVKEAEQNGARENITAVVVGANVSDNASKVDRLRSPSAGTPLHFASLPLSFRRKFNLSPKMLKLIAFYVGIAAIFIIAVVFAFNQLRGFFFPETPSTLEPTGGGQTVPGITAAPTTTPEIITTTRFDITTHDDPEATAYDDTEEPPTDEPTSPAITTLPPITPTPDVEPTIGQTAPPEPPETTAPPEPTEPATDEPTVTEPATEEETAPPETEPPTEITEEPTIAAEPPPDEE